MTTFEFFPTEIVYVYLELPCAHPWWKGDIFIVPSYPRDACASVQDFNFSSSREKICDPNSALGYFQ